MISLAWRVARHKEFKLFVENRVIGIRNLIPIEDGIMSVQRKM